MGDDRKRHCWECLRRRLVCDSSLPTCKRCSQSGTPCPGYGKTEPRRLKWLAPGAILSRASRKKRNLPEGHEILHEQSKALDKTRAGMFVSHFHIKTDLDAVAEAAEYFNTCIYLDLEPIRELGPYPHIYRVSPAHVQAAPSFPDHIRMSLVCIALSHRINKTRDSQPYLALIQTFHKYRGLIIRSLIEDIEIDPGRRGVILLAGIISLLIIDSLQGASPNWECHLDGARRLINLNGGIRALAKSKGMKQILECFIFMTIIGNTTTPASDLIPSTLQLNDVKFIQDQYITEAFPFQMVPPPLLVEIMKINILRMQASGHGSTEGLSEKAYKALGRIEAFSSEQWAGPKPSSHGSWAILGKVYQSASILYCILALQSVAILPADLWSLRNSCIAYSQALHILLQVALSSPSIKRFMLWPLVVLGIEAVNDNALDMRLFVQTQLSNLSYQLGSPAPLAAKNMLKRFWDSGETRWDACFDSHYIFVSQISLDLTVVPVS